MGIYFLFMSTDKKAVDLVEVTWIDADTQSGWLEDSPEEDEKDTEIKAYGLLVSGESTSAKYIVLSFLYDSESNSWLCKHRIPKAWVTNIRKIETYEI